MEVLPDIHCPVQVMLSARDEMFSLPSAKELSENRNISITTLSNSTHYYYSLADRSLILEEFMAFISLLLL